MMLLLDTHVTLWWCTDQPKLRHDVRRIIASSEIVWVSAASAWEVAIKQVLGRLRLPAPFAAMVIESEFSELPVRFSHAERAAALPRHHSDPFDRMLIAQAAVEGATLVTHDRRFEPYGVPVVWV